MSVSKKNVLLTWLAIGIAVSATVSLLSLLYMNWVYEPSRGHEWKPVDEIAMVFIVMPVGWIISLVTPAGWLSFVGLGFALRNLSRKPLVISAIGSVLFGVYWPRFLIGMMGT